MQIRRSLWITFAFSNASTIALFLVSLVLARILTPKEIGMFSVCMVIVNMAAVLRELGTNPYLVAKGDLKPEDVGAVFGLTLTTSWVIAAALYMGRHWIAAYFGEPQMGEILAILLLGFLMVPVAGIMSMLLTRDLSAGRNAFVTLFSTAVYCVVLLTLAYAGLGARAPAWANAANLAGNVLSCWIMMPKGFRMRPRWSGWAEPVRFGRGVMLTNFANTAHQSLPDAVIGRGLGAHDVGLFSRANGTVSLFQQVVGPTLTYNALPIIAKTYHTRSKELVGLLMKSTELLTVLAWPVYALIAVFPTEIITLLYGPTWAEAAGLVPWLCLAAAARTPFLIIGPALQAVNKPFIGAACAVFGLVMRILVLLVVGYSDLQRFAMLLCLADVVSMAAWAWCGKHYLGLGWTAALVAQRKSALVALACLAACLGVHLLLAGHRLLPLVPVLAASAAVVTAWLASLLLSGHPFAEELKKTLAKLRG